MKLSKFGTKVCAESGIGRLMSDLGEAFASGEEMLMLGAGNPAKVQGIADYYRKSMDDILAKERGWEYFIGDYDGPDGYQPFRAALAEMLQREFGWNITEKNVCLTNGSQTAFFILFNMLAGTQPDGSHKRILFPLAPEYIGYSDVGLTEDYFVAGKPEIRHLDEHTFKYYVDFESLEIGDDVGAICVSRPTNPTGNVLTNEEVDKLCDIARAKDIPLILDNAYGTPFPDIIFADVKPVFNDQTIVCMSLSKLGIPAARTGIVIAHEDIIKNVVGMNGVICLAPGGIGARLALESVRSGDIIKISNEYVKPFYKKKADQAAARFHELLAGTDYHIHKHEGALFLWLWFRDLPIDSAELYTRLKDRGVVIVPGHYFFPGISEDWRHKWECIRVSYAQEDDVLERGLNIIAEEVKKAYAEKAVVG